MGCAAKHLEEFRREDSYDYDFGDEASSWCVCERRRLTAPIDRTGVDPALANRCPRNALGRSRGRPFPGSPSPLRAG